MAGEYSRELSVKVFAGQCRLIELGFRQGGAAGFVSRRVLVNERGEIKGELKRGEHKSLQTDRVILMPGPDEEVAWVNKMYRWQDHQFTPDVTRHLRKMKAARQIEAVELMIAANTITAAHADALLKATPPEQRAD